MESGTPISPEVGLALAENVLGFIFFYARDRRWQTLAGVIGIAAIGTAIAMAGSSPETEAVFLPMAWSGAAGLATGAILGWIAGLRRPESN